MNYFAVKDTVASIFTLTFIGCEIDLENEKLQKLNGYGKYPLFVNATGDIIYPVGEPKLTFGKILCVLSTP